jgi:prophage DNA circulation protein
MAKDTTQIETHLSDLAEAVYEVEKTLDTKADGTNWTVADGVSNIAYELSELNKTMKSIEKILLHR